MEIEIVVKGGVELEGFYPEKYVQFEEEITALVLNTFPGVTGCFAGSRLTDKHQEEETARQEVRDQELKNTLLKIKREDPDYFRAMFAEPTGA